LGRKRFEYLFVELCMSVERLLPRYGLWLHVHEADLDPEALSRDDALAFCGEPLTRFLAECGAELPARDRQRLVRLVARYDPAVPTPYEQMARGI
jgi:hypothetical protein